jgi:lambda family phage portal protein
MGFFSRVGAAARFAMTGRMSASFFSTGFEGAMGHRRLIAWRATQENINSLLSIGGDTLRARARQIVRSNPYASNAADSFVSNAVGCGIKPSSLVSDIKIKDQIQDLWAEWVYEADADGLTDFYGLQGLAARAMFEAGECFVRFRPRRPSDGLTVPLQLQVLEAEFLPFSKTEIADNGNQIRCGIEFNAIGQRVAYYFYKKHPGDSTDTTNNGDLVRVPADQVLHLYRPLRPGQIRGVPWISPALVKLYLLDQYDDAELDRKKVAALFAGFITKNAPEDNLLGEGAADGHGASVAGLSPGMMQVLLPGEDIKFSNPADVGNSYEPFQYRTTLAVSAAMGEPYANVTGDLRYANYSSIRAGIVEYRRRLEQFQDATLIFQFCRPIWQRWMSDAVLAGALNLPGFAVNPRPFLKVKWIPPKWDWVDPLKDRQAEQIAQQMGWKAPSDIIEEEGSDVDETFSRIAQDQKRAESLGINLDQIVMNPPKGESDTQPDPTGTAEAEKEIDPPPAKQQSNSPPAKTGNPKAKQNP